MMMRQAAASRSVVSVVVVVMLTALLLLLPAHQHHGGVAAFSPVSATTKKPKRATTLCYLAKTTKRNKKKGGGGNKLSYAERLQQHKAAQLLLVGEEEQGTAANGPPVSVVVEDGTEEKELAKEMINAQRRSVDMLTFVRERVEGLPIGDIVGALFGNNINNDTNNRYIVIDDFLANEEIVSQLQQEGRQLFEHQKQLMETDLSRLGSGESIVAIKGGEEQYTTCPRTVELVVSTTKHLAGCLSNYDYDFSGDDDVFFWDKLDPLNCMASLRTYDRASQLASLSLVEGGKLPAPQSFDVIVNSVGVEEEVDARKVTMLYYPVAHEWSSSTGAAGGGIAIEAQSNGSGEHGEYAHHLVIAAKRDRLILLRSDSCRHRPEYFDAGAAENDGNESLSLASWLELHLVARSKPLPLN